MGVGVGSVVGGLMQLRVFGCSFGWELWRCMVSISDSTLVALVEAPVSPVFSSSSSTTTGSSEIRQQKISGTGQKCTRGAHLDCYQLHWVDYLGCQAQADGEIRIINCFVFVFQLLQS